MAVLHDIWQQGRVHYKRQLQYFIRIGNTVIFYPSYPRRALLRHQASLHHSDQLAGKQDLIGRYGVTIMGEKEGGTVCLQWGAFSTHIITFVNVWGVVHHLKNDISKCTLARKVIYVIFHWPIISSQDSKNTSASKGSRTVFLISGGVAVKTNTILWRILNRLWNTLGNHKHSLNTVWHYIYISAIQDGLWESVWWVLMSVVSFSPLGKGLSRLNCQHL